MQGPGVAKKTQRIAHQYLQTERQSQLVHNTVGRVTWEALGRSERTMPKETRGLLRDEFEHLGW